MSSQPTTEEKECHICGGLIGTPCNFMEAGGSDPSPADHCQPPCVICGGEGTVNGSDHYDPMWDYQEYSKPFATCTSCGGSGLAKDMSWC